MAIRLKDKVKLATGLNTPGPIDGLTLAGGVTGTNYNISNINQISIADPGEGIVFLNGSSGTITLAIVDDSSDNILRLSGGNSTFEVQGTGTANAPTLALDNSSSSTFNHSIEAFTGNMTANESNILVVGKEGSTKNSGYIGYYWTAAGNNNNFVSIGHWGNDHLLRIYGSGNVTVPSGDFTVTGDIMAAGQIRATGWWNNNSSDTEGTALEIGVSGPNSSEAYILSYNRSNSSYGDINFDGINYNFNQRSTGTFSANGFSTSTNLNGTGDNGLGIVSGARLGFDQSGTRSWTMKAEGGNLNVYSGDGNGGFNVAALSNGIITDKVITGGSHLVLDTSLTSRDLFVKTGGTTHLTVDSSASTVGISTTAPGYKLDIRSATNSGINISGTSAFIRWNAGDIQIKNEGSYAMGLYTYNATAAALVKRLNIDTHGATSIIASGSGGANVFDIQGSQGQLFSVTDDLTGDIFSVSDVSGVPILNVNSNGSSSFDGDLDVTQDLNVGDGSSQSVIKIKKADNNVGDHIQFYNGTTRVGEIGVEDDSWLRINQVTNKNIYTPRYFRADGGLFVDSTSYGIDGNGRLTNASLSGTYTNSLTFSGTTTFSGNIQTQATTYLGNGNGDQTHINDILYLGATDSGDSHFYFGENSSNWYGEHWYWDSGHTTTRYSRHAGTDTAIERHDTRNTHKIQVYRGYERMGHSTGYQIGSYNSVAANSDKTNPIYVIGDSYRPSDTSISGMYGVGYAHNNLWGSGKSNGWGFYVAENGSFTQTLSVGGLWSTGTITSANQGTLWGSSNDGPGTGLDADTVDGIQGASLLRSDAQDAYTPKRIDFGASSGWDAVGFGNITNLHVQGHNQFWFGAGNGTWFTGTANSKSSTSGLAADASAAHDTLITTMQGTSTYDRGITFAVDSNGAGNNGWRLGKWHSSNSQASSKLTIDGGLHVRGGDMLNFDYYADDYSTYWDNQAGGSFWTGDTGWIDPSITAGNAIQIQAGNTTTNSNNPALQFHQYGYGGIQLRYEGPSDYFHIESTGTNRYDWLRNKTDHGYIDFGPANTGHAHIYTDRSNFYFNKELRVNGGTTITQTTVTADTGTFTNLSSTNNITGRVNGLADRGFGDTELSFYQDSGAFGGVWSSGWASHIICNHGNGSTYYNQIIHMPFWGPPQYSRQEGNTSTRKGPYAFCTSEASFTTTYTIQAGTLRATADVVAYYSSDKRLKDNIIPIGNAIDKIKQIGGYEFDWNDKQENFEGHDYGVIAQEVEKVLPELVKDREDGYKGVRYEKLTSVLIQGIKEQQDTIENQQKQIDELKDLVNKLINK